MLAEIKQELDYFINRDMVYPVEERDRGYLSDELWGVLHGHRGSDTDREEIWEYVERGKQENKDKDYLGKNIPVLPLEELNIYLMQKHGFIPIILGGRYAKDVHENYVYRSDSIRVGVWGNRSEGQGYLKYVDKGPGIGEWGYIGRTPREERVRMAEIPVEGVPEGVEVEFLGFNLSISERHREIHVFRNIDTGEIYLSYSFINTKGFETEGLYYETRTERTGGIHNYPRYLDIRILPMWRDIMRVGLYCHTDIASLPEGEVERLRQAKKEYVEKYAGKHFKMKRR